MKSKILLLMILAMFTCCLASCVNFSVSTWSDKQDDEIDETLRAHMQVLNTRIIESIKNNDMQSVKDLYVKEFFEGQLAQTMNVFYQNTSEVLKHVDFSVYRQYLITSGSKNSRANITAKLEDQEVSIRPAFRTRNSYLVFLEGEKGAEKFLLSLLYEERDKQWKVQALDFNFIRYYGKTCTEWFEQAEKYYKEGKLIPAVLSMDVAYRILHPASYMQYSKQSEILRFVKKVRDEVKKKYILPMELSDIDSKPVLYSIKVGFFEDEAEPVIWYITKFSEDDKRSLRAEAELIHKKLIEVFPGIEQMSSKVMYQAIFETPVPDVQKEYVTFISVIDTQTGIAESSS